jgi:hypothetical protein
METIKELFEREEFEKLISTLKTVRLESISPTSIISKVINTLDRKALHDKIFQILLIFAKYRIVVLDYELKEGIRILINSK